MTYNEVNMTLGQTDGRTDGHRTYRYTTLTDGSGHRQQVAAVLRIAVAT